MLRMEMDDSGLRATLRGLTEGLEDLRPVWPGVHTIFREFINKHFQSEGEYAGERWAPLSPGYAWWKLKHYPGKPLMHLTERLYQSLMTDNPDHVYFDGPSFVEMGTRVPYAWAHQKGRPDINLPARTVIPTWTRAEGERIVDVVMAFLLKKMRGA